MWQSFGACAGISSGPLLGCLERWRRAPSPGQAQHLRRAGVGRCGTPNAFHPVRPRGRRKRASAVGHDASGAGFLPPPHRTRLRVFLVDTRAGVIDGPIERPRTAGSRRFNRLSRDRNSRVERATDTQAGSAACRRTRVRRGAPGCLLEGASLSSVASARRLSMATLAEEKRPGPRYPPRIEGGGR
jgi:hypothetical protein